MTKEFSPFLAALGALRAAHLRQSLKMWGQVQQADLSKNGCPYLSGEDTRREDVLNCLLLLIAEKTILQVL